MNSILSLYGKKGFTLIEITLSIGILAGIILGAVALFGAVTSARAKIYAAQEVTSNARIALAFMEQKIRLATAINSASSTFGVHPSVLSIGMSTPFLNPTVISVLNQRLQITEGASSAIPITSAKTRVSNLVFTQISYPATTGGIGINLTLEYNNLQSDPNFSYTKSYQTTVMLKTWE